MMFAATLLLLLLFVVSESAGFVLLGTSVKYTGDQSSFRSYYNRPSANASAPLVDYMRTLYEQEKTSARPTDYNLIRALAPRTGKSARCASYAIRISEASAKMSSAFSHPGEYDRKIDRWMDMRVRQSRRRRRDTLALMRPPCVQSNMQSRACARSMNNTN